MKVPTWTEWFEEFRERLHEEITIRSIQRKLRAYRGIPDICAKNVPKSQSTMPESVRPGSREDRARPIWMDQGIEISYHAQHRRMEAEAEYVEWEKKVGEVGDPGKDRVLTRITVWQAVYVEPEEKVDKAALTKAVLVKLIAAAKDTDYFDRIALKKEAEELVGAVKS